tara:strand:+ start:576 stop:749 length:174 start_codon:yes stop_codon:yes gene_type:complete
MNTYRIRTYWSVTAMVDVEGDSLEDAIEKLDDMGLPPNTSYVEDSFESVEEDSYQIQ